MCKEEYEKDPEARKIIDDACEILNRDIKEHMFNNPENSLNMTCNTQPAIFLYSYIMHKKYEHLKPTGFAGYSQGQYMALVAAGCLTFEDCLRLISIRAWAMYKAGLINPGMMAAIIGLSRENLEKICLEVTESLNDGGVWIANINPGQLVISGTPEAVRQVMAIAKESGAKKIKELPVSGAFHTKLVAPAALELDEAIKQSLFNNANVPVYLNHDGLPYTKASDIEHYTLMQLTSPVEWDKTLDNMYYDGYRQFQEIGPGTVLTGFSKRKFRNYIDVLVN
jgi:[acyl-carrier-protein] S-malonyltransferase